MDQLFFEQAPNVRTLVFKPSSLSVAWLEAVTSVENKSQVVFTRSKSVLSWIDMPNKLLEIPTGFSSLAESDGLGNSIEKAIYLFKKIVSLIKVWASSLLICWEEGILSLSKSQLKVINSSSFLATFALFLKSIIDMNKNFRRVFVGSKKYSFKFCLLLLAKKICTCVMCLFGILGMVLYEPPQSQWIFLSISTFSLSLSISKYYYCRVIYSN